MRAKLDSTNPIHLEALKKLILSREGGWLNQHYVVIGLAPNLPPETYPAIKTKLVRLFANTQRGALFGCSHGGWSFELNRKEKNPLNWGKDLHGNPHFNFVLAREELQEGQLQKRLQKILGPAYSYAHIELIDNRKDSPFALINYLFKHSREHWEIARNRYGMEETAGCCGKIWNEKFAERFYRSLQKSSPAKLEVSKIEAETSKVEPSRVPLPTSPALSSMHSVLDTIPPSRLFDIISKLNLKNILAWGGIVLAFSLGFAVVYFLMHYKII